MCYSDRLGISYQSSGLCRLVVGRIEEMECRVILTEHVEFSVLCTQEGMGNIGLGRWPAEEPKKLR